MVRCQFPFISHHFSHQYAMKSKSYHTPPRRSNTPAGLNYNTLSSLLRWPWALGSIWRITRTVYWYIQTIRLTRYLPDATVPHPTRNALEKLFVSHPYLIIRPLWLITLQSVRIQTPLRSAVKKSTGAPLRSAPARLHHCLLLVLVSFSSRRNTTQS